MQSDALFRDLEAWVEGLGYELVDLERAGNVKRPILRLRIDRPDSAPGAGVSLDDCTRVSRALEQHLDVREDLADSYVLEVSSPGVERPLVRPRDWRRFAGSEVAVRGRGKLPTGESRLQGTLLGLQGDESGGDELRAEIRLPGGEEVSVRLSEVKSANLVYQWGKE
jgi:ribosome maturation factor RimP